MLNVLNRNLLSRVSLRNIAGLFIGHRNVT